MAQSSVWPQVASRALVDIPAAAIFRIPRDDGWLALAIGPPAAARDFVILAADVDAQFPMYARDWGDPGHCLHFDVDLRWDISTAPKHRSPNAYDWTLPGVIVVIEDRLYLRTAERGRDRYGRILVDVCSGQVRDTPAPNGSWSFAAWKLVAVGPEPDLSFVLHDFEAKTL